MLLCRMSKNKIIKTDTALNRVGVVADFKQRNSTTLQYSFVNLQCHDSFDIRLHDKGPRYLS